MPHISNFLDKSDNKAKMKVIEQFHNPLGIGLVRKIAEVPETGGLEPMPKGLLKKKGRVPIEVPIIQPVRNPKM